LPPLSLTERGGFASGKRLKAPLLNLRGPGRDQVQVPLRGGKLQGLTCMESVRPDNSDPIPLRRRPHNMANIMIRFVGLLLAAVVALALIWSR
jgi:hypothetical protein